MCHTKSRLAIWLIYSRSYVYSSCRAWYWYCFFFLLGRGRGLAINIGMCHVYIVCIINFTDSLRKCDIVLPIGDLFGGKIIFSRRGPGINIITRSTELGSDTKY